jgi:hypothetical protein
MKKKCNLIVKREEILRLAGAIDVYIGHFTNLGYQGLNHFFYIK